MISKYPIWLRILFAIALVLTAIGIYQSYIVTEVVDGANGMGEVSSGSFTYILMIGLLLLAVAIISVFAVRRRGNDL